jgi:hypothetical protein
MLTESLVKLKYLHRKICLIDEGGLFGIKGFAAVVADDEGVREA